MKRIVNVNLDLQNMERQTIILKQMDTTQIQVNLTNNGEAIDFTDLTAEAIFTKPDTYVVIQNASIEENKIIIELKKDCVRKSGMGLLEVELLDNEEVISSFQILVRIEKTSKAAIEEDNTLNYIERIEIEIENIENEAFEYLGNLTDQSLPRFSRYLYR